MLLRMISAMNKWDMNANPILREDPSFPADSVTDLKTTRNKLSVWKASSDDETNDAIVALALGRQSLDKPNSCMQILVSKAISFLIVI